MSFVVSRSMSAPSNCDGGSDPQIKDLNPEVAMEQPPTSSSQVAIPQTAWYSSVMPQDLPDTYRLVICVGEKEQEISDEDLLEFLWAGGLDALCMECRQEFDPEPPFRTARLKRVQFLDDGCQVSIEVHNRHFSCIPEGFSFSPISHVWHSGVAKAQDSRTPTRKTTQDVRETIVNILLTVWGSKEASAEIWHDYISVPQWQRKIQRRLLSRLPGIYGHKSGREKSVIHLHDTESASLDLIMSQNWWDTMQIICPPVNVPQSTWKPQRKSLDVNGSADWELKNALRDRILFHTLRAIFLASLEKDYEIDNQVFQSWSRMSALLTCGKKPKTMGEAVARIANQDWRFYRDRFVALGAMLDPTIDWASTIPEDTLEASDWFSRKRLEKGDLSPLLLAPSSDEIPRLMELPKWVRAYTSMDRWTWGLGSLFNKPSCSTNFTDNILQTNLELIGTVLQTTYSKSFVVDPDKRTIQTVNFMDFGEVMQIIMHSYGEDWSTLLWNTERIFWSPMHSMTKQLIRILSNFFRLTPEEITRRDYTRVENIITPIWRSMLYQSASEDTEITSAGRDFRALSQVQCPECNAITLHQLHLWCPIGEQALIWRIPNLRFINMMYLNTNRDPGGDTMHSSHPGLVIERNKVVGRLVNTMPIAERLHSPRTSRPGPSSIGDT